MKLRPINNWVTVEVQLTEETTKSGIITGVGKKPTPVGVVIDISSDIVDPQVTVGDTIMFSVYDPMEVGIGDYKVSLISYSDIYGVVE